jgi:hypothetical protein
VFSIVLIVPVLSGFDIISSTYSAPSDIVHSTTPGSSENIVVPNVNESPDLISSTPCINKLSGAYIHNSE